MQVCPSGYKLWAQPSMSSACWTLPANFKSPWLIGVTCQKTGMGFCSHPIECYRSQSSPYQADLSCILKYCRSVQHAKLGTLCT